MHISGNNNTIDFISCEYYILQTSKSIKTEYKNSYVLMGGLDASNPW